MSKRNLTAVILVCIAIFNSLSFQTKQRQGEEIHNTYCAMCHVLKKHAVSFSAEHIVKNYDSEWIFKYVYDSEDLVNQGDSMAIQILERSNQNHVYSSEVSQEELLGLIDFWANAVGVMYQSSDKR